jgi:tRNA/rRNA methyltransferase
MTGTDRSLQAGSPGAAPVVVLVQPQLGQNIGAVARAMKNFGLSELRLVDPRDGWPNEHAWASASGADDILGLAEVFATTAEAISDVGRVFATTARERGMTKTIVTPREAAVDLRQAMGQGINCAILFGGERAGLGNDDIALADTVLSIPTVPGFASLNLAQAVLLTGYEWLLSGEETPGRRIHYGDSLPASKDKLVGFFEHLEAELLEADFLKPPPKVPNMIRNLRNIFQRAHPTDQEVQTLRGVVRALVGRRQRGWPDGRDQG